MNRIKLTPLFEKVSLPFQQNLDCPQSQSVSFKPSFHYEINQESRSLLQKIKNRFGVITSIGISWRFFVLCRKMLLERQKFECYHPQQTETQKRQMETYFYNKIEIGLTKQSKPIEWIFCEVLLNSQSDQVKHLMCSFFMSTCVILQVFSQEELQMWIQMMARIDKLAKTIKSKDILPDIILVATEEVQVNIEKVIQTLKDASDEFTNKISFVKYIYPFDENLQLQEFNNVSKLRQISLNGKKILNSISIKTIERVIVTPNCLINFALKFLQSSNQAINLEKVWKQCYKLQVEVAISQTLNEYSSKFQELTLGRQIISKQIFEEAHVKAKSESIRKLKQRFIKQMDNKQIQNGKQQIEDNPAQILQELRRMDAKIDEQKKIIQNRNVMNIYKWGRQLLNNEFVSIEKKIKLQQIKSINSYKQQMTIFKEFFKKKTESYLTIQLFQYFEDFIFNKFFEHIAALASHQTHNSSELIKTLKTKNLEFQNENKQLRKRLTKQENDSNKKDISYRERLNQLESKIQLQQKTIERINQELLEKNKNHQKKIIQINEEKYTLTQSFKIRIDQLENVLQEKANEMLILESEIKKEKLLHEQSHQNYRQLIALYKDKETKMLSQIQFLELNSQQQIQQMKRSSVRQAQGYQEIKNQVKFQNLEMFKQIQEKEIQILKLKEDLKIAQQNCNDIVKNQIALRDDLQLKNKILEEKNLEFQIKFTKFRRIQEEMFKIQKQRDEIMDDKKQTEKQYLIVQQRIQFLEENLRTEKQKYQMISQQLIEAKTEATELHEINSKLSRSSSMKIMVDQWVQAEDEGHKQKLKEALQIVTHLENQYNKLKAELRKSKFAH